MSKTCITARGLALGWGLAAALASGLSAQAPGRFLEGPPGQGWRPTLGIRVGLDYRNQDPSLGALLRLPVPGVPAALVPSGDLVFHQGLTERQGMVDLAVSFGGLHLGAGPVALSSIVADEGERETKIGYTLVAGVRSREGRFGTSLEFRLVRVDELSPNVLMLGLTWTPGAPSPRRGPF